MSTSVLYVVPDKMGGVVTNLTNLQARCDRSRFFQYTVLTHNELDRDTTYDGEMGGDAQARFHHLMPLENLYSVLRRFQRAVPSGVDVLVSSDWLELAWAGAYEKRCTLVHVLHGDFDYYYDLAMKHEPIIDVFVTCSLWIREKLVELLPHREESILHIPYGVPIPAKTRRNRGGPLRLLYAGRLVQPQKRILDLPRIDHALRGRDVQVQWTIVGGGPDREALREGWASGGNVQWRGVLSNRETVDLMAHQDVLVLPSEAEGLPLSLLEAMSVGVVPVVSDLASGIREVVEEGVTGRRVPVGDIAGFADSIAGLDTDRGRLEAMSRAARRVVCERFDVELQAARYEDLYARWRELRRPRSGRLKLPYGSRLDRAWIPNPIVRFVRGRRRPELRALLKSPRRS